MAGNTISGGNAKKYANYARMGGVVLLVAAGGLWALELPGMQTLPEKPAPAPAPAEATKPEAARQAMKVEPEQVSDAAERLEIAWVKAEKKPEPIEIEEKPDPTPAGPEWTYLGPIKEAGRSLAMVSVEGSQRILAVGRLLGDTKLVGIEDDKIVLDTKGTRRDVHKSSRSGPTVAWLRGMPANTPMGSVGAVAMPGQPGQMSPEVIQRLRERGIDPAQAQRFRDMGGGNQGRNRGQPAAGRGGPGAPSFGGMNAMGAANMTRTPARATDADNTIRAETAN